MKKIIVILFTVTVLSIFCNKKEQIIIPDTAIRFRIIANSNSKKDQEIKYQIKSAIEPDIMKAIKVSKNIENARNNIISYIPTIKTKIDNFTKDYNIQYGNNYFPEKIYKGVIYPEGEYESLVVTLGNGLGENWWCVLFPPLCLLEGEESEYEEPEYRFYVADLINKYVN